MPSITMENNVIHNNEGYGVILVKANCGEQQGLPADQNEDEPAGPADSQPGGSAALSSSSSAQSESTEARPDSESSGTEAASSSGRKWHFSRQLSRSKEPSCSRAVQDLMQHQIFVSIQGNQFRRNGMGDFGTFFY
ncbi:SHC SH2 domain-binding protein 1-like [Notothenia coriiceps]|uniref:SHC SH2 domain-binding protein 1-like n=1 Tax=Notothenia coriiceps TaxID=8208 RepID=A0A6I9PCF7_9TELE|nr:PREDICTED: SHC SH2 domain-binding protein 1-like [Notothenia coriiceps]